MNEETEKPGAAAPAAKMGCVRRVDARDVPRIEQLWARSYGFEANLTPEKNPVSIVLQNEAGQTEMALVGEYFVTAFVHLVADPASCRSIAADENAKLLVGQLQKALFADPSVGAIAVVVPRSLRSLEKSLTDLGLRCREDLKVYLAVVTPQLRKEAVANSSAPSM
jgi:hypothetical protein